MSCLLLLLVVYLAYASSGPPSGPSSSSLSTPPSDCSRLFCSSPRLCNPFGNTPMPLSNLDTARMSSRLSSKGSAEITARENKITIIRNMGCFLI
ncbi:hypothetical protein BJV82DRAFT_594309 [Fennellomyces sp. T-0311]|nr:hypothetical protein BJV82DRAFT_594309 [Fennellomyces sp. T-0311]